MFFPLFLFRFPLEWLVISEHHFVGVQVCDRLLDDEERFLLDHNGREHQSGTWLHLLWSKLVLDVSQENAFRHGTEGVAAVVEREPCDERARDEMKQQRRGQDKRAKAAEKDELERAQVLRLVVQVRLTSHADTAGHQRKAFHGNDQFLIRRFVNHFAVIGRGRKGGNDGRP